MAPKLKFAEGEKVLCFHGPLIYEAKCLKSSVTKDKHVRYLIHYAGWNKNWDEWVPESRVLKYNDANVQRQKEVQKAHSAQPVKTKKTPAKGRKSEAATGTTPAREESRSSTPAGKEAESTTTPAKAVKRQSKDAALDSGSDQSKKKRDHLYSHSDEEEDDEFMARVNEIKVKMPYELKVWLVDDYCAVTREQKIVNVPSKITVEQIINNYLDYKRSLPTYNENTHSPTYEISEGIKDYFNATLESHLLHYNERPQYNEILEKYPNKPMVQIYGPIHLLRLFTRIGAMLSYSTMDEESLQYVFSHIEELINYMWENREMLMNLQEYVITTPEYRKKIPLSSPS